MTRTIIVNAREALVNLAAAKLRSLLALLGILVGTASVVAMVLGGELATNEALKQFKVLGTDLLAVTISDPPSDERHGGGEMRLTLSQAASVPQLHPAIRDVAPYAELYNPIQYQGRNINGSVLGVTNRFADVVHVRVQKGRFISSWDNLALFCVVGHQFYEQMKKLSFGDPLGKQIQIGTDFFTIVGVAEPWLDNSFVYASIDNAILIPISTALSLSQYASINNIILRLTPDADSDQVSAAIRSHFTTALPNKHLYFRSAKELIASMGKQNTILTVFLGLIGSVSLLVGGIGVMNIMLVSVMERKREIGIRLAVGARRSDIRLLFLIEAIMLALVGGASGVVIGIAIAYVIALIWQWEFILYWLPAVIGFSVSVAIGIFFGFYPAHKAAQLDPIAALRSD